MVQLWVAPDKKRDSLENYGKGNGILLQNGIRGRRFLVLLMAVVCSLVVVLGWEGSPASTVLGNRAWRPALRLELALFAGALDLSRFSKSISASQNATFMDMLNSTTEIAAARKASPLTKVYKQEVKCDYTRGKWVKDSKRPIYSGETCTQFLSTMWSCRLIGRTDLDYERYRWQPDSCDLPAFDGLDFLSRFRNKTIAFVGDSLGRQQFQSLLCMITAGRGQTLVADDVANQFGFMVKPPSIRPNGWAYRFRVTNTTIVFYWSATLCEIRDYNYTDGSAMHIDKPVEFLRRNINRINVVILNTGHHWNTGKIRNNKWEIYLKGKKVVNPGVSYSHAYAVKRVVKWLDKQIKTNPGLRGFITGLSPRHFMNGEWDSGGRCDNIGDLGVDVSKRRTRDILAEEAVLNTEVKMLNITYLSQFRGEAHISRYNGKAKQGIQDCLHWCLPGVPDVWNEILNAHLLL